MGESGCGKTTLGRLIVGLYQPTEGTLSFWKKEVKALDSKARKDLRRRVQMVFQDPYASLNPRMTVDEILREPLEIHGVCPGREREERVKEILDLVGLQREHLNRFPHELSGGQRQRVGIARALILRPEFVVLDESTSALDVSIRAQIINLLEELRERLGLSYLFISHDLATVRYLSTRLAIMYLGKIVEIGDSWNIYRRPLHPYTRALLSALPLPDPVRERQRERLIIRGEPPSPLDPPPGCPFVTRCLYVLEICRREPPPLEERHPGHQVACFRTDI